VSQQTQPWLLPSSGSCIEIVLGSIFSFVAGNLIYFNQDIFGLMLEEHFAQKYATLSELCSSLSKDSGCSWVLVAHTCNPSYSGSRDQRILVQSQPWANSS
jgi:hypothetical protein